MCGMTLREYILKFGVDHCAILFGVKPRTIDSWKRGERYPRPEKAHEIVSKTEGKVTIEGCYTYPEVA